MTARTPPVVLDTNVVVAGACRHRGSRAYAMMCGVLTQQIPVILTPAIVLEYQDVLLRPRVMAMTTLSHAQCIDLVDDLIALSCRVQHRFTWRPNLRDEDDNKFVEAAVHASAIVVTYNTSDFREADMIRFGWSLMAPDEFLKRYEIEEGL